MIVVVAGRRVDADDAEVARFPSSNVEMVSTKLKRFLSANDIDFIVSSGACGADLIALDMAGQVNIPRKMVLPFDAETFRATSVIDRPGNWGLLFDKIYVDLQKESGVIELPYEKDESSVYEKTNFDILDTADEMFRRQQGLADEKKVAVIIWEGVPKDSNDTTNHFKEEAFARGYEIKEINCLH
ncbi:MAG: hypothetical protein ABIR19_09190 [Ginsengibacter sp.]